MKGISRLFFIAVGKVVLVTILKLSGILKWSWAVVTSPLWVFFLIIAFLIIGAKIIKSM